MFNPVICVIGLSLHGGRGVLSKFTKKGVKGALDIFYTIIVNMTDRLAYYHNFYNSTMWVLVMQ